MDADVILVCDGIGEKLADDPCSALKRLKALRIIFRRSRFQKGTRLYALRTKRGDVRKKKLLKRKTQAMKECRILGRDAGWIFFIAPPESVAKLLAIKGVHLEMMDENTLHLFLTLKRG